MKGKLISKQLQELVSWSVAILGDAIKAEYGIKTYNRIENLRKEMKGIRGKSPDMVHSVLAKELKKMKGYSTPEVHRICYSFSLMLELINRCETAYRNYRLNEKDLEIIGVSPEHIIFVLTAHPTEARSPEFLVLFKEIEQVLGLALKENKSKYRDVLYHAIVLSLKISLARSSKPTVADEADNIYSFILEDEILCSLINLAKQNVSVSFRTWVGGDKDGHPGVDEKTMLQSLNLSREKILLFLENNLKPLQHKISLIKDKSCVKLESLIHSTINSLENLHSIKDHDGLRVVEFQKKFNKLAKEYEKAMGVKAPAIVDVEKILWIFPALVVPLEVREDSEVVAQALSSEMDMAITKMLKTLGDISSGFEAKWYVRGFVLSMVQDGKDVQNGFKLSKKILGGYKIPVVPLFENEQALTNATEILNFVLGRNKLIPKTHQNKWGNKYEIMVGYSDSSKENGVLPSRLMIAGALKKIETCLKSYELKPVFFHGSGGSIERGGGSLKEQTSWWPKSALQIFKSTIQGEMVARNFASANIFEKQIKVISQQLGEFKSSGKIQDKILQKFADEVRAAYSSKIQDEKFLDVIEAATPYSFLHHLKIGSRPAKRSGGSIKNGLRAIPWILCWTQTRILFPTWWGVGSAWSKLNNSEKQALKKLFKTHPVLGAYVKALGFTLAKIELGVWKLYLAQSKLDVDTQNSVFTDFKKELKLTEKFFSEISNKKDKLWFRPWLQQSIDYRSSMIHPINLCQLESLRRKDHDLLRTSVTGVACGMLTTG